MLDRLRRETEQQHAAAIADRLQPLTATTTRESYTSFLCWIWGFEAPLEAAFAKTRDLAEVIDLRGRTHMKLLRADLVALGITSPSELPYCRMIPTFKAVGDALGWMYVIENNVLVNGQLRRHLETQIPKELSVAGSYLFGGERSAGSQLNELGRAFDGFGHDPALATQIVEAAKVSFQRQRLWFGRAVSSAETSSSRISLDGRRRGDSWS